VVSACDDIGGWIDIVAILCAGSWTWCLDGAFCLELLEEVADEIVDFRVVIFVVIVKTKVILAGYGVLGNLLKSWKRLLLSLHQR
jgi:hypothetical protein